MLDCPHRPPCPGCPRLGEPDVGAPVRAALESLASARGLSGVRVVLGAKTGFRHRARLAVRGRSGSPKIGIFEAASHRIVDIPRCLVHHPMINDVAREVRGAIRDTRTPLYSDQAGLGLVRYLQVVIERRSTTAQVVVVANDASPESLQPLLSSLSARLGGSLHSLFWNGNSARTNTILGPSWHRVAGPDAVEERVGGARIFYPPGAFGQSNLDLSSSLVDTVHGWVPDGARVVDLYSGTGAMGLGLAGRVRELVLNELAAESRSGLELGVAALDGDARARTRILPGTAGDALASLAPPDVVIADPPRKGLDADVLDALCKDPPRRLVYVACGLGAFLEDERALTATGHLRLAELVAYDLFPHTEHVETVARFDRTD